MCRTRMARITDVWTAAEKEKRAAGNGITDRSFCAGESFYDFKINEEGIKQGIYFLHYFWGTDNWASYALFWSLGWDYKVSTALSWAAAVLFAFVTNKFWVFRSFTLKLSYLWKEFVSFVACRAATGVLTMLGMILMVDGFHWNEFLGKLMVSAMSLVLNYIMSKLFIFKKKKDEEKEHGAG